MTLSRPVDGQPFTFGDTVPYEVKVTDPEDSSIDCDKVKVTYLLGHDSHEHQITSKTGCSGTMTIPADGEHDAAANLYGVLDAEYTDSGGLTTHDSHVLQPRHRQAEHFSAQQGIQPATHGTAEGGATVGFTDDGDWIAFKRYAFGDATKLVARVSSGGASGTIEVRTGSATGPLLGSVAVPVTGNWETFQTVTTSLTGGARPASRPSGTSRRTAATR